jgi:hypothetical protein
MKHLRTIPLISLLVLVCVTACAPQPVQPSTTTDQILAAQFHAQTLHGALSGKEAQSVVDQYHQHIGAKLAETSDTMDSKQ